MSTTNKTQLQTNNTKLDTLTSLAQTMKDKAAALPEAGSGGSVETCTVTVATANRTTYVGGTVLEDGNFAPFYEQFNATNISTTIENVVVGSFFVIRSMSKKIGITTTNLEYITEAADSMDTTSSLIYKVVSS